MLATNRQVNANQRTPGHVGRPRLPRDTQANKVIGYGWRSGKVVAKGGIEPPTRGFSIRCSTN